MLNPYDEAALCGVLSARIVQECPFCGAELCESDGLYLRDGCVVGCEYCISPENVYEYDERRRYGEDTEAGALLFPS